MTSQYPVMLFEHDDYLGRSGPLTYGSYASMDATGIPNDSLSSIKVAAFTEVVLYFDLNFKGRAVLIIGPVSIASFTNYQGNIDNAISSLIVTRVEPTMDVKLKCCQGITPSYSCGEYAVGSLMCTNTTAGYCGTHMNESQCQSWCRDNSTLCDKPVNTYCALNPQDPYCSCVNSIVSKSGAINPKCVDKKCLDTGYLTTSMANTACPTTVTCEVNSYLQNSGVILSNTIPIQQNCGAGSASSVTTVGPGGTSTSTGGGSSSGIGAGGSSNGRPNSASIIQLILVMILFIVIAVCLVIGAVKLAGPAPRGSY